MRLSSALTTNILILLVHCCTANWEDNWDSDIRTLDGAYDVDPLDGRTTMRGSGSITLGSGTCVMKGSPRLYISASPNDEDPAGWEDVEFTAYGKFANYGSYLRSYSGLTLVARSSHSDYKPDGCSAAGYYARIYQNTGEASFQKEYYHGDYTAYSSSRRVPLPQFSGGLPLNTWIGIKFVVYTVGDGVQLELWLDTVGNGQWELVHWLLDVQGQMPALKDVPSQCTIQDGDPVLRSGKDCFLRSDGSNDEGDETEVHWRDASIRKIDPTCRTGLLKGAACCAASCGTCGGTGCSGRPGGGAACCTGQIKKNTDRSCATDEPPCLLPDPFCATGILSGEVCCAASCGSCGGTGCSSRPGGGEACCTGSIKSNMERSCDRYPPPCLVLPL